jgi:beta-glucanase (GH16 family)
MNIHALLISSLFIVSILFSAVGDAAWQDIENGVEVTQSRTRLDRTNDLFYVNVFIKNTTSSAIKGPLRLLVENANLPVLNSNGVSDEGVPYLNLSIDQLAAGRTHRIRVDFQFERTRLSFDLGLQQENQTDWELIWNDEFDGSEIDLSKWTHEVNCDGGGNQEKQCYTSNSENSFVQDGKLNIVALPESGQVLPYSSARLISKNNGDWSYGRFEIRAKAPRGQGSWPAIWMLPTDYIYGGWPHSGEMDIFESVNLGVPLNDGSGDVETTVHGTLHYGEAWPNNDSSGQSYIMPENINPADEFHVYAMEWEEGEIRWYVDDVLYVTQLKSTPVINEEGNPHGLIHRGWYTEAFGETLWGNAPFDNRFHLIMNFAVGGNWPENVNLGGVDSSAFNASNIFEIEYVRVYECSVSPVNGQGCATVFPGYIDLVEEGGTLIDGAAPVPFADSTGIATDLILFENEMNPFWPAWVCCDGISPSIVMDDEEHAEVLEFAINDIPAVAGFNIYEADIILPYDGSPMLNTGVLSFDMKLVNAPNNPDALWFLKVEQAGQKSLIDMQIDTPSFAWKHYEIPLKTLRNLGLNLNGIDAIMLYPAWGLGEGAVYRVDNVNIKEGTVPPDDYPDGVTIDFENAAPSYSFINFDGGVSSIVANPYVTSINTSAQVVQMQKFTGQVWGGSVFNLDNPVIVPQGTVFRLKVWSEREVSVLFKLEGMNVERTIYHGGNGWQELPFDFGSDSGIDVTQITLFFDIGTIGDADNDPAEWTFYYDDLVVP